VKKHFFLLAGLFILGVGLNFTGCSSAPAPAAPAPSGPAPLCSSPTNFGLSSTSGLVYAGIQATGYVWSDAITIVNGETATSINLYVGSGPVTGQVRYGIYVDNGNVPGNLVYETTPQNIVANSWNTASLPNIYLPANGSKVYWLAYQSSNGIKNGYLSSAGNANQINWTYGVFPDSPGVGTGYTTYVDALYISACP
jgi:hypothetical protein